MPKRSVGERIKEIRRMFRKPKGWVEVICGCMFAGKTEELLRRCNLVRIAGQELLVFQPAIDDRHGIGNVQSHNGQSVPAIVVGSSRELLKHVRLRPKTQVVAISEAQFFDLDLPVVCQKLVEVGIRVIIEGLDMDFRGEPFGPMPQHLAMAREVLKLKAICEVCRHPSPNATMTQRLINGQPALADSPVIQVGGKETYQARCADCHVVPKAKNKS